MSVEFTARGYRDLIEALLGKGYAVRSYADAKPSERHLILRHDVDLSLEAATRMGELEAQIGVRSIYFVLVRSTFYNPFSAEARAILRRLQSLGHAIGLHFDPATCESPDLQDSIVAESKILALACGGEVTAVSFHRPVPELLRGPEKLAGLWNAYGSRFVQDVGYCSDSRGEWKYGDPLSHPAVREGRALQLLTHPIWWNEVAVAPAARLDRYVDEKANELARELAANSTVYMPRGKS